MQFVSADKVKMVLQARYREIEEESMDITSVQ